MYLEASVPFTPKDFVTYYRCQETSYLKISYLTNLVNGQYQKALRREFNRPTSGDSLPISSTMNLSVIGFTYLAQSNNLAKGKAGETVKKLQIQDGHKQLFKAIPHYS